MMNVAYLTVLQASAADRRDLFLATAQRLGTNERNVEKDFWVCWTLDALFNGRTTDSPRLLFKGGTSLSKAFGLINRFSEDVDITVFRQDIGEGASVDDLEAMSGKKRQARLDGIRTACRDYITGDLFHNVATLLERTVDRAGISDNSVRVAVDPVDPDGQTLLVWYPSVTAAAGT